ncbi:hypothetical protein [Aurantimonas sp. HBX-1]|uniref:hypothetical protein n=1 Tax=Aurantimonas sp. HBX-1 TaxID=2906072 RepID=UPI001F473D5A|nr:hypothetical protein [Aurantimonas sp. HBX-1]UIJ71806.1 hypothetical protein LXB15_19300 [Aurantimonas sp. HBX-1]
MVVGLAWFGVLLFDPIDWRYFLIDREYAEAVKPFAVIGGATAAVGFTYLFIKLLNYRLRQVEDGEISQDDPKASGLKSPAKIAFLIVATPILAYMIAHSLIADFYPAARQHFSSKEAFSGPFVIRSFHASKACRGVRASNPEFAEQRICGVKWRGRITPYLGETMIVEGERSPYGLTVRRYTLPEVTIEE